MVNSQNPAVSVSGIFARNGQLYAGGPLLGMLQKLHPASRLLGLLAVVFALTITKSPILLLAVFSVTAVAALISYLDIRSIIRLAAVPIFLFAFPAWIVAYVWTGQQLSFASLFLLRSVVSVAVVAVGLHSIGLKQIAEALKWMRFPVELRTIWAIMISQVVSFSEILSEMLMARDARKIQKIKSSQVRLQIGRQAGVLFGRMHHRGQELAYAMESRSIGTHDTPSTGSRCWMTRDILFTIACFSLVPGALIV